MVAECPGDSSMGWAARDVPGMPEKQELPNFSELFLNRSNTPRRGGGRRTGI